MQSLLFEISLASAGASALAKMLDAVTPATCGRLRPWVCVVAVARISMPVVCSCFSKAPRSDI